MNVKSLIRKKKAVLISILVILSIIVAPFHITKAEIVTNEEQVESFIQSNVEGSSIAKKAEKNSKFIGNGYEIYLVIDSQWEGAFNGNITLINTGTAVIEDWVLEFNMNNQIVNIWNGIIYSHEENTYVVKNAGWNQDIPVGGSINFGFSAIGNEIDYPECYVIPTAIQDTDEDDYSIDFTLYNDWGAGFTAAITITNHSNRIIEDWVLEFEFGKKITDIWNGVIYDCKDNHYIIKNVSYNQNILPGQSLSFGFNGIDGNILDKPKNYKLSEYTITNLDDNINENQYNVVRTEDSVIGIAYFQELETSDICIEEDGIQYVKNQINLVGTDDSQFEQFVELGDAYGFEIVGYIEFTKDYQIKFLKDKTYRQMNEYIAGFSQYDFIEEANLNLVIEVGEDFFPTRDPEWPAGATNNTWNIASGGLNWGVKDINAPTAWDYISDMYPVKIGLIDNMFDETHEDLDFKKVWNNPNDNYIKGSDGHSHGTHVVGTMAAGFNNGVGISGIAVQKELYAYSLEGDTDAASKKMNSTVMEYKYALSLLIGNGVRVINVSQNTGRLQCYAASMNNEAAIKYVESNAKVLGTFLKKLLNRGFDFVIVTAAGNVNFTEYIADVNEIYGYRLPKVGEQGARGGVLAEYNNFLNYITEIKNRIIVVGAYGLNSTSISSYSNIGTRVDIAAPGDNIYSTIIGNTYDNKGWNGTSMAAPHVAGTAALVYSANPALTGYQVKNIIMSTANAVGLTENTGTYTYDTVNAGEAVKKALATKGINLGVSSPTGVILGIVQGDWLLADKPIENVMISAYRYSTIDETDKNYFNVTNTDSNGEFELILDPGTYHIEFYKSGYLPLVVYDFEVAANEVYYMERILVMENYLNSMLENRVYGTVRDAITDETLSGVEIKFREGWNKKSGKYVGTTITTDATGKYSTRLDRGYYTAELSKDGYIMGYMNVITITPTQNKNQDAILSPVLEDNEYRIVLTWGSIPGDLDSHMYGKTSTYNYHVYYGNKRFTSNGNVVAELDIDKTTSYGPETITIKLKLDENGIYNYYVHDYSNKNSSTSNALSVSGANVKVYKGNNLFITYFVPTNKVGTLWNVFRIENGVIKSINTLTNDSLPNNI